MTKLEYKCIELMIDKYTVVRDHNYDDHVTREICNHDIDELKAEIKTLVDEADE